MHSSRERTIAPRQRRGVWLRKTNEENVLLDPAGERLFALNDTALALWELCDGSTTPDEMIQAICVLCNGVHEMIAEDVERTLAKFTRVGLIDWDEVGGS